MTDPASGAGAAGDAQQQPAPRRARRPHRFLVPTLLVLATVILFAGAFAIWVNRQALNTDNWATTSGKLLANKQVDDALGAYLVNELFTNVDVETALQQRLPPQAQALAGPASAGLREVADRAAPQLLAAPRVQDAWVKANTAAHKQFLRIVNDEGAAGVSTASGNVTLNLHALVSELARSLGIQSQVAAARAKLQGSRGKAQQKLGVSLPATSGELVIMRSDQLETAQDVVGAIKGLAIALPALAVALFALAVWLARGRRRVTLRTTGWCLVAIGLLLLLLRRVGGNEVVDALVKVPSNRPAMHEVWNISTRLLYAIAVAAVVYGLVIVASAWLAGSTRPAGFLRQALAPTLRERPGVAYGVAAGALLLLVVWGPTAAFRNLVTIALFAGLLALGVTMLRRQTALEFPDARHGDATRRFQAWRAGARARRAATPAVPQPREGGGAHLDELERLAALHDRGDLTDEEFAAEKTHLGGSPQS